jgi:N-acetyl-gamma-glutamyl-phosphate reductase
VGPAGERIDVGIVGASGYTGAELLRLCAGHPYLSVTVATAQTHAGRPVGELYPSLAAAYPSLVFSKATTEVLRGLDLVFIALPHGESQHLVPELAEHVGRIVDLSADFRLRDASTYKRWYGSEHVHPEMLGHVAYGLPELFREDLDGARLVAVPGCYPTAAALALAPLLRQGAVEPEGVIVDAASGVSGAGSKLSRASHFNTVDEDYTAYGLLDHRHTPEIEQATGAQVLFTPHLAPMNRGILATCYSRARGDSDTEDILELMKQAYAHEPFVVVSEASPSTKATLGSNCAHVTARMDSRTGFVISICAIDNLVKGASGQAVQCANLLLGLPEVTGLSNVGIYP